MFYRVIINNEIKIDGKSLNFGGYENEEGIFVLYFGSKENSFFVNSFDKSKEEIKKLRLSVSKIMKALDKAKKSDSIEIFVKTKNGRVSLKHDVLKKVKSS